MRGLRVAPGRRGPYPCGGRGRGAAGCRGAGSGAAGLGKMGRYSPDLCVLGRAWCVCVSVVSGKFWLGKEERKDEQ